MIRNYRLRLREEMSLGGIKDIEGDRMVMGEIDTEMDREREKKIGREREIYREKERYIHKERERDNVKE